MSESATENKTAQQQKGTAQTKDQKEHIERDYVERPKNTTKLQIKNLQFGTTKEDLHDLCRRFGQIVALEAKGTSGFVTYYKPDEAQLAIYTLDGYSYRGFILRVQFAREPLPQKTKDGESTVTNTTSTSTTTTTTASSATTKTDAKPTVNPVVENKPRFAQQQQLAKPKQTTTFVQQPKEQPQNQNQQNPNQKGGKKKGQQNQQNQQNKGKNQKPEPVKEVRTYRVSVEKTVINAGDQKEEGFTFPISHQQYLDYIIPLLKDIQTQKEKEKEKDKEQKERS